MQMKTLINKIKQKKELKNIENNYIIPIVKKILSANPKLKKAFQQKRTRSKEYKEIIKKTREKLRLEYGMFSENINKREKFLKELKNTLKQKELNKKLLKTHKSTAERIDIYPFIYQKIFKITGKPKKILDLGCGMNPVSFQYMKLKNITYYASELNKKDCEFLQKYFNLMKIKGKTFAINLKKPELVEKIPLVDVCFLFKVLDTIEKKGHKLAEEILSKIKAKFIVTSFATHKLGGKPMKHAHRGWLEKLLERKKWNFTLIQEANEIFYIIKKSTH